MARAARPILAAAQVAKVCRRSPWGARPACLQGHQELYSRAKREPSSPGTSTPASGQPTNAGGNIGDILKNGLGGLLGAGAAGTVLSGGLNDLLKQFQQAGQGNAVNSWVGSGPNKTISADDLAKVLDSDQIKTLMAHAGLSRDEVLNALSEHLPGLVNEMTPNGRPPTEQEVSHMFQ